MHASLHLRISQHQPVAQQKLYVRFISAPSGVELVCSFDLPETRTMCVHLWIRQFISASWMLGRKPESNYSRDDIRSIQIPRAFQPPVHCAHLYGFLALDAIASLREHTIIFHLYFRSQIPRVAHSCALELIFGSAARFSAPGWIFPHPSETSGILCPIRGELVVNIPQASPLCLQISGGAYQQIADTLTISQLAEPPILTTFFLSILFLSFETELYLVWHNLPK